MLSDIDEPQLIWPFSGEVTLDKIVVLAVFLSVLSGQSGNTGCQALAVTLRGMTLGELKDERLI